MRVQRRARPHGVGRVTRPIRWAGLVGLLALVAAALVACSERSATPPGTSAQGTLSWRTCEQDDRAQCATLAVPIDRTVSGGPTLDLSIIRYPATTPSQRIGVLLVNPGGPGGSGKQFLLGQPFAAPITQRFDIVSWDPRGVGESSPLHCGGQAVTSFLADDPSPEDAAEQTRIDDGARAIADQCAQQDPALSPHLGSVDTVDDMDAIRGALGESTINYIGFSYGTLYGLRYAEKYPQHLRAWVLDGVVDPTQDLSQFLLAQTRSFEQALQRSLDACSAESLCPLAGDPRAKATQLSDQVQRAPLSDGAAVDVGPGKLSAAYVEALYDHAGWPTLWAAIERGLTGDGSGIAELAANYYDYGAFTSYAATTCVDLPHPVGTDAYRSLVEQARTISPLLGPGIANEMLPCAFWPAPVTGTVGVVHAPDAPPSLVIGRTGDPATPYANSVAVASTLHAAHLVTSRGDGHTSYNDSTCVHDVVDRYLLTLEVPAADPSCD